MKQHRDLSFWLLTVITGGAVSVACVDDVGAPIDTGMSGATAVGGTSAGVGGSTAGTGGAPVVVGGSTGTAGVAPVAGTAPMAGSGGMSGGAGGTGGAGGSAGSAGAAGSGGNTNTPGPFGVVSCQPAFEVTCKPNIVFENAEPNGKGKLFTDAIPDVTTTMKDIACVACSMLYRTPDEIPNNKHPSTITLKLDFHGGVAQAGGGQIQFDLNYINSQSNRSDEQFKREMMGVLQHETVHLYQNYGNGGTGEGEADLVRVRMGYYEPNRWSPGGSWRDAYTTSGNFYSWLTGPCSFHPEHYSMNDLYFPYKLNKALGGKSGEAAYTAVDQLLQQLFGKNAETLWDEYQSTAF
jgi:hypothetical protein